MMDNSLGSQNQLDDAVNKTLQDLTVESAKRREKVVLGIPGEVLSDPRVIRQLHLLAGTDPVEYVRVAARKQLTAVGEVPAPAVEPPKVQSEGIGPIVGVVVACVWQWRCVCRFL